MTTFAWDEWNVRHIDEHAIAPAEAEHVVRNARPPFPREIGEDKYLVWGQTAGGCYLQVIFVYRSDDEVENELTSIMAKKRSKLFFKMTAAERDAVVKQFDREILFEETRPLSPKGKALWERAKRAAPTPKRGKRTKDAGAKAVVIPIDKALLDRADRFAKRRGMTRTQLVVKGLESVIRD
jgi:uncharacterized DUF497 family protein